MEVGMVWALLMGCGTGPATRVPPVEQLPGFEEVQLTARDDVALVADVWTTGPPGPAIVLLHMTPVGGWNRLDWPADFVQGLLDEGFNVLALDRRGAGDSGGVADDAFEGVGGRYDVEAAVLELQSRGLGPIGIIGASNGTTSALDYARWAGAEGLPEPFALGFMTGGSYTENQNAMAGLGMPSVFTYSSAERSWSVDQMPLDPGGWVFHEYADGDHGTLMFEAAPEVKADLATFFAEAL